jgi:thioredoxin-like negative regulator of GroEL
MPVHTPIQYHSPTAFRSVFRVTGWPRSRPGSRFTAQVPRGNCIYSVGDESVTQATENDAKPLLAFFRSEASGPARRMDSLIAHLARKERDRLRVTVVDVDSRPELAERFHVDEVPTLILAIDHRIVERLEGRVSAPTIDRMLERHLPAAEPASPFEPAAATG